MSIMLKLEQADRFMREKDYASALKTYQEAWPIQDSNFGIPERVWLLLSIATAAVRLGDYEEACDAVMGLYNNFANTGLVVGNPYFHLMTGLTMHGLGDNDDNEVDNFARTLICGGPEMFKGEDPAFLQRMKTLLKPPAELGTWDGYEGSSRDQLNGAMGYVREVIAEKIGRAPPYHYDE